MKNEYCVYVHTNKTNGKKYVGITRQKPENRWHGGSAYKYNPHFYKAINKYGWDGFDHEVLMSGLTKEQANQWEVSLIAQYGSTNPEKGYNVSDGGEGHVSYSKEMRRRMSEAAKRRNHDPVKHENLCEANRRRWRREGEREKITDGLNRYYSQNPERREAISKERRRYFAEHPEKKTTRSISQFTLDGDFVRSWDSMTEAANSIGATVQNIHSACSGRVKTSYGYIWRYNDGTSV